MTAVPLFAQLPLHWSAIASTSNSSWTGNPSNVQVLGSAGASGALLTRVVARPRATATANFVQIFHSASGGTIMTLLDGKTMAADTVSSSDAPAEVAFSASETLPWRLAANDILLVGISLAIADGVSFQAEGAHF